MADEIIPADEKRFEGREGGDSLDPEVMRFAYEEVCRTLEQQHQLMTSGLSRALQLANFVLVIVGALIAAGQVRGGFDFLNVVVGVGVLLLFVAFALALTSTVMTKVRISTPKDRLLEAMDMDYAGSVEHVTFSLVGAAETNTTDASNMRLLLTLAAVAAGFGLLFIAAGVGASLFGWL